MRWCWNWQTGMVEGHVPQGVGVQLPPSALKQEPSIDGSFDFSHRYCRLSILRADHSSIFILRSMYRTTPDKASVIAR
jgi:hypothetical protein